MRRRMFNFAAAVSLALCLAAVVRWFISEQFPISHEPPAAAARRSRRGRR
ncbi:MAG TPA: hypothetical protein VK797_01995 [Tepidisphaeraceae bacterium]|nr:hypothetical protein [Tepidisphaeraceae bacterium]